MVNSMEVIEIIRRICGRLEKEKDYLTRLDQPIGDSDHGINMARGFQAVEKKLADLSEADIGEILKTTGMVLVSTVGGASGPLYGSAFLKAGMALAGKREMDLEDFLTCLGASVEAVKQRGKATAGEATMLDAMIPALQAMREKTDEGQPAAEVLSCGVRASWEGVEHTKGLVATKGRASYVGERGLGHEDPGAASFSVMLETIAESLAGAERSL